MRVLIVEDNRVTRLVVAQMLRRHARAQVAEAETADEAYRRLEGAPFSLLLVSGELVGTGGLGLVRRVRAYATDRRVPIILVTNKSQPEDVLAAIDAGANDVLLKPVQLTPLLEKAHRFGRAHAVRQA